jgi:poly-gamma-glutamate capsule biosynthesis protein CapA/YwtB (metallophosphatase superfamily)
MKHQPVTRLSRRRFLAWSVPIASALLGACTLTDDADEATPTPEPTVEPDPQPTPTTEPTPVAQMPTPEPSQTPAPVPVEPVRIAISPQLQSNGMRFARHLAERMTFALQSDREYVVEIEELEAGDIAIHPVWVETGNGARSIRGEPLIPVVALDQFVNSVTSDQLASLLHDVATNWTDFGGQDRSIQRVAHRAANLFAGEPTSFVDSTAELIEKLHTVPGLFSMVPRSEVDFHVQVLLVDELDPLRDELTSHNWEWWERAVVSPLETLDGEIRAAIDDLLNELDDTANVHRRTMMTVVGDVILGRTVHRIMTERNDFRAPFVLVTDELQRGDLTVGNLECALTDSFSPPTDPTTFSFMTFPQAIEGLQFAGFHALSGANNHSMDFGAVGIADTRRTVEGGGIQYFGAGNDLQQARQPAILEHNGVRFALLGYDSISMQYASATASSGGIAPMIREYVEEDIVAARSVADVVIPYFHWGVEYVLTPETPSRQMAYVAIDAGADLVLGSHPHWVQGMEFYRGTAIFYSLSNFVFDQEWSLETKQSIFVHLVFDGTRFVGFRIVPALIEDFHRPRVVEDEMREIILERFWRSSRIIESAPIT